MTIQRFFIACSIVGLGGCMGDIYLEDVDEPAYEIVESHDDAPAIDSIETSQVGKELLRSRQLVVPKMIEDRALEMLPPELLEAGYALHYQPLSKDGRYERYRISFSLLGDHADGYVAADFANVIYLTYDSETKAIAETAEKSSGWAHIAQEPTISSDTLVVRFFEHPNYSGDNWGLYAEVTKTGVFYYNVPNAGSVGMNDVWSSFYTRDAVSNSRVGSLAHDIYNVKVWKDTYFSPDNKWFDFGGDDYDSDFDNDRWRNSFLQGKINDKVSSFKVTMSVFTAAIICGDDICEGNETASSCRDDCGYCGDGVCYGSETRSSCYSDCGYCGDNYCTGPETVSSCRADCGVCGDGICSGPETAHSCHDDCGYCGDGICTGSETESSCPSDCGGPCDEASPIIDKIAPIDPCDDPA